MDRFEFDARSVTVVLSLLAFAACGESERSGVVGFEDADLDCQAFTVSVQVGNSVGKDAIPSLVDPVLVDPSSSDASYLRPTDRVIGLVSGDEAVAVPLNIGWYHEIVNLEFQGGPVAVTHCPLTGSSIAFDRSTLEGAEFGVTGLLFKNNLIMYDRRRDESFWPQMGMVARCGVANGNVLSTLPVFEMTWESWVAAHPETKVVSSRTGHNNDYTLYPYGLYDVVDNPRLIIPMEIDPRRFPKERVLGIPEGAGGLALPFRELARLGAKGVVDVRPAPSSSGVTRRPTVVFWDAQAVAASAFSRQVNGQLLTFSVVGDDIVDSETGSVWRVDGEAVSGPLQGTRLTPIREAYVAFWFAWAAFVPSTEIWEAA